MTTGALRRTGTPALVLVGVASLIASAVALGAGVGADRSVSGVGRGSSTGYARNAIGKLAPVNANFAERQIGASSYQRLRGTPPTTLAPRRSPSTPPVTAAPQLRGTPGGIATRAPGEWALTVQMASDRATVRPGDEIRYRMTITNTGNGDFRGLPFVLEWHTPSGTFGRNALPQCELLPVGPAQALCATPRIFITPGLGEASEQRYNSSGLVILGPGEKWTHDWYVQVLAAEATAGEIHNHAHLTVRGKTIDSPDVVVKAA